MPECMYQNPERLDREQPRDTTAEVQGNYPNFKLNLAKKKVALSQKSMKASRCLASVV